MLNRLDLRRVTGLKLRTTSGLGNSLFKIAVISLVILVVSSCGTSTMLVSKKTQVPENNRVTIVFLSDYFLVKCGGETYRLEYDDNGNPEKSYDRWMKEQRKR